MMERKLWKLHFMIAETKGTISLSNANFIAFYPKCTQLNTLFSFLCQFNKWKFDWKWHYQNIVHTILFSSIFLHHISSGLLMHFLGGNCCKMKPKIRNTQFVIFPKDFHSLRSIEYTVRKSIHKRHVRTFQKFLIQNIYVLRGKVFFVWDNHIV